ncbi:hypothetical protein WJX74_000364 [Apatococcus lobatus]|uniref:Uncharacterized protein n=2 Tax=Apatococcus TaxID=904362 RepID=A0AAW1T2V4_9CHLO
MPLASACLFSQRPRSFPHSQEARLIAPGRLQQIPLPQFRVAQYQRHRCISQTAVPEDVSAMPEDPPAETPEPPGNPLFSAQFQEALKGAMQRQGGDVIESGEPKKYEEPKPTAAEEVLQAGLQDSRRNIIQLENIIKALEKQQEREQKQFERLHFAYKRAQGDAAYIRSCEKRLEKASQTKSS